MRNSASWLVDVLGLRALVIAAILIFAVHFIPSIRGYDAFQIPTLSSLRAAAAITNRKKYQDSSVNYGTTAPPACGPQFYVRN